jgi:hypothetical protein
METQEIWDHQYTLDGQLKNFKAQLINYHAEDYQSEDPSYYNNIRTELDKKLNEFLDAYHINPLIPMRFDVLGKPFKISMGAGDTISIEKLEEDKGLQGYGKA